MVKTTEDRVRQLMHEPASVRNISVIAHVDHGKTTLTDSLLAAASFIRDEQAGYSRKLDFMKDEAARGITIKSTGITLPFVYKETPILLNLIDSPGHVDFSSEVTAALRVTDGALVVVDCVEGVSVQTETVLRQALKERIKPVLVINKVDRLFMELQMEPEEIYRKLHYVIDMVNSKIAEHCDHQFEGYLIDPLKNNVAFTSAKLGWGFGLFQFAELYARGGGDVSRAQRRLWGDHFRNTSSGKWSRQASTNNVRGFCCQVVEPLKRIINACLERDMALLSDKLLPPIGVTLTAAERELPEKQLLRAVMRKFLPCHLPLVAMVAEHLPSPLEAQKYRAAILYTGDINDVTGQAIANCDPNGPLSIFVSKMIPEDDKAAHFTAFGRVFSGTARPGAQVQILGPNYNPTTVPKHDCFLNKKLSGISVMMGGKRDAVESVPAGNTVALSGIDKYLVKTGTIVSDPEASPLKNMAFTVAPVVRQAIEAKRPQDTQKLADKLKMLCKTDPLVEVHTDKDTGEFIIAGAGELHLEICISQLQDMLGNVTLSVKEPVVTFNETVTIKCPEPRLVKSGNKHNRIYAEAEPLGEAFLEAVDDGRVAVEGGENKQNTELFTDELGWDRRDAKSVCCFGPAGGIQTNVLVDQAKGVAYWNEIKDMVATGFQWATGEGALCGEPLRGVKFNLTDGRVHADAIHRSAAQIVGPARRLFYATQLSAEPRLMEPIFEVEISTTSKQLKGCYMVLQKRRAQVLPQEYDEEDLRRTTVRAYLPVVESFGFDAELRGATGGEAFAQLAFHHWQVIDSDPLVEGTKANELCTAIRKRKGMSEQPPAAVDFYDKL
mmetsp:Transcript_868/g.3188  ORF Transcript_868/g.3188 Transcript_868/m.3188 type:complete len:835 (-) Transcript_868:194-2698(-)|eukprot:CAMPEP_0114612794 /NCGR_PEP_ID=MMETSP0168-20121206/4802_1 /TAXON_ID=95228 ORGANISM="Vannella sp., Strain DIVA3 517/6/12" /NCGR_SAMPLE_ID=MMETSP0168 /ASSEMBLY_ACC=CAM_ASM_000044 /LENGTH=834 /DNA_ID=CAMNT_0001823783 /DNA_START=171 /DNA_END=2675 /DNA_ORIENTATION=-